MCRAAPRRAGRAGAGSVGGFAGLSNAARPKLVRAVS
jgi:hypothetical protein